MFEYFAGSADTQRGVQRSPISGVGPLLLYRDLEMPSVKDSRISGLASRAIDLVSHSGRLNPGAVKILFM